LQKHNLNTSELQTWWELDGTRSRKRESSGTSLVAKRLVSEKILTVVAKENRAPILACGEMGDFPTQNFSD
tara:strand:- start:292 stop:504 length:213 start_codon:yes stop_codon:yes gene_type:complete